MATPLKPTSPPQEAFFDDTGGISKAWQYYLYQTFTSAQQVNDLAVLGAFDAPADSAASAAAADANTLGAIGESAANVAGVLDEIRNELAVLREAGSDAARIDDLEKLLWTLNDGAAKAGTAIICDTHANLASYPAAAYPGGALYFMTDWKVLYVTGPPAALGKWVYSAGEYNDIAANMPAAGTLGANDAGLRFASTDYKHAHRWSGTVWDFANGDPGSAYIVATPGAVPHGGLWQTCDGTNATCMNGDGTTASVPTPDTFTNSPLIQGGAWSGNQDAATAPKWDAAAVTDDESGHTHSVVIPSVNTGSEDVDITMVSPGGVGVPKAPHIHATSGQTVTSGGGAAHHHALSDALAKIKPPSEANGGMALRVKLTWYIRR